MAIPGLYYSFTRGDLGWRWTKECLVAGRGGIKASAGTVAANDNTWKKMIMEMYFMLLAGLRRQDKIRCVCLWNRDSCSRNTQRGRIIIIGYETN